MLKDVKNFFKKKREWSIIKDELLACYLKPYFSKIINTKRPINYIDCFSGKGKFDDGKAGSPLIALDILFDSLNHKNNNYIPIINTFFIERDYAKELKSNLTQYKKAIVIEGAYQDTIKTILMNKENENVFLYIDPFGIKCLNFNLYDFYSKNNFSSIELLINFNSFGFIREACRIKKFEDTYLKEIDDIIKVFDETLIEINSVQELNEIAGGIYWEKIIDDYQSKKIDCYEAEKRLSEQYCNKLKEKFNYVVNMPIRLKAGQKPKYRMIHATNNEEGCLLMVQNICKRWENLSIIQTQGQGLLFDENIENEFIDENFTQDIILKYLENYSVPVHMNNFLSELFTDRGVFTKWDILQKSLKHLEKNKKIILTRNPQTTPTGKPSTFLNESRKDGHSVKIGKTK